jgi:hypothetical protein
LIAGKFEKPHCLKDLKHYPCNYKSCKNTWVTERLFREWLVSVEREMAGQNRNALLILDHYSAHSDEGLNPTSRHLNPYWLYSSI